MSRRSTDRLAVESAAVRCEQCHGLYSFTEGGNTVTVTNTWSYTVVPYAIIPSANKVDPGTVTFADAGFKVLVSQMDHSMNTNQGNGGRFPGDGNRLPAPEAHLARQLLDGTTGLAFPTSPI